MKAETATAERVRVKGKIYIARTLAATTARMSYGYLARLCSKGKGPQEYILMFDGKQFFPLTEVKRWARAKAWRNCERGQNIKRTTIFQQKYFIEVGLSIEIRDTFKARYPNTYLSTFMRNLLIKNLEQQS